MNLKLKVNGRTVCVISTSSYLSLLRHALSLNIQGYFQKPADVNELREVMQRGF